MKIELEVEVMKKVIKFIIGISLAFGVLAGANKFEPQQKVTAYDPVDPPIGGGKAPYGVAYDPTDPPIGGGKAVAYDPIDPPIGGSSLDG
jgi:hypothetical protein